MLYCPWPSKQLHLAAEKRRLREVTLPKVKLLVRGPEIRTPQCLTAETRRSACALGLPFLGLEKLPAVPVHTACGTGQVGGRQRRVPRLVAGIFSARLPEHAWPQPQGNGQKGEMREQKRWETHQSLRSREAWTTSLRVPGSVLWEPVHGF